MASNVSTAPRSRQQAAIDRAMARAHEQSRIGNVPTLLAYDIVGDFAAVQVWSIGSRTVAGGVYTVDLHAGAGGVETRCDCAAGGADRICWHRAAARLAATGVISHHDATAGAEAGRAMVADEAMAAD